MPARPVHRSAATPLAVGYALLITYASLYPFTGWRYTADPWWLYLVSWPYYWLRFDVISNFVGYMPLGLLAGISLTSQRPKARNWPLLLAVGWACCALSFGVETIQNYLPGRVPSLADLLLNSAGAWAGVGLAAMAVRYGWIGHWQRWRDRSMTAHSRGLFVLVFIWPLTLLYPSHLPFALGQVYEPLIAGLQHYFPRAEAVLQHLPRSLDFEVMSSWQQSASVAIGLLLPLWTLDLFLYRPSSRFIGHGLVFVTGTLSLALGYALNYEPAHAWIWLTPSVQHGMWAAAAISLLTLWLPRLPLYLLLLGSLVLQLFALNYSRVSSFAALEIERWQQGQFVRFYGLSEWLGWLWPFVLAALLLLYMVRGRGSAHQRHA